MASNNSTAKTHVSLRLPTYLLESIDAHAEKESISRTEAFVHYLQTGLEISDEKANEPSADEALLQSIQSELAEIKAMLKAGGANIPAAAFIEEDDTTVPVSFMSEEDDEVETEDEFTTSDAVYESVVEVEEEAETEDDTDDGDFSEGAEDEAAAMFDASDAVASPDEMPVEEVVPTAPVSNVFSPNYQPAAAVETVETEDEEPMETLSDYYEEAAAEQEAEDDFTGSDAVEEDVIEDNPYVSSSYFSNETDEDEDENEAEEEAEEFSGSDAVFETFDNEDEEDEEDEDGDYADDDDEFEEEVDEFDASDEMIDVEEADDDDFEAEDDDIEDDDENEFDDSDAVEVEEIDVAYSHEDAANLDLSVGSGVAAGYTDDEDELDIDEVVYVEPLALSDLEDAVALVAQQFPMIEKIWLFGNAATGGTIEQDTIDLCIKAEKFKSKYADLFISMLEDNTGKSVNVVLRSEMEKSVKQIWKATRIDLYRA